MTTNFFKKLIHPGGDLSAQSVNPRLVLAAFGKHPGWNDHIPGIGMETETLAQLKQAMYVTGIGGRIDSGVWKALDAEKRLEGFDHTFLSLRGGHVITGRMFSSEDGLHRKEYPMVLCVDSEGISAGFVLPKAQSELDRLRDACRATSSAEQVTTECRMAQDRLRGLLADPSQQATVPPLSTEARRRFLEHRDLGPDRVGLLRALHELGVAGDAAGKGANGRSYHLRLPLATDSRNNALLLWAGFFRCAVSASSPLLLIARTGVDWLDVIIGEPTSDDFFCLQASPKALPLASQIPYELTPELKPRLQELEAKFQGESSQTVAGSGPASGLAGARAQTAPAPQSKGLRILPIVAGVVLLAGAGVWWLMSRSGSLPDARPVVGATNREPPNAAVVVTSQPVGSPKTNDSAREEARVKSEAERQRLAEAKRVEEAKARADQAKEANRLAAEKQAADAKAAGEAQLKKTGTDKVATNVAAAIETRRVEDDKTQALAMETDVNLARTALAQGNYERTTELCQKWSGVERFQQLLQTVAGETNQLRQVKELLQAGNYAAILTNRLPDNARFKEILTNAALEKKILDQAGAEFVAGDYAFLQRPEVQALQAKPPFQKLIQAGGGEAGQLEQARKLKAANKPQEAKDFIAQAKLAKPPFADIHKWATTELERMALEQHATETAKNFFDKAEYDRALELCQKYFGIAAFNDLARSIKVEQQVLTEAGKKFSAGDYTFLVELSGREYGKKPPFVELARKGEAEKKSLGELEQLKQQNRWQGLPEALSKLSPEVAAKKPFADLRQWAVGKAAEDEELKKKDPGWLDADLEKLLVWFNVVPPTNARIRTPEARKQSMLGAIGPQRDAYLREVDRLEEGYRKGGWLNQDDRDKYLKELKKTIKYWE